MGVDFSTVALGFWLAILNCRLKAFRFSKSGEFDEVSVRPGDPLAKSPAIQISGTVDWADAIAPSGKRIVGLELVTAIRSAKLIPNGSRLSVGRTTEADFCIATDRQMSRLHFAIDFTSEDTQLMDLESTNGTYLNGQRVTKCALRNGDKVIAGMTIFAIRFVYGD